MKDLVEKHRSLMKKSLDLYESLRLLESEQGEIVKEIRKIGDPLVRFIQGVKRYEWKGGFYVDVDNEYIHFRIPYFNNSYLEILDYTISISNLDLEDWERFEKETLENYKKLEDGKKKKEKSSREKRDEADLRRLKKKYPEKFKD